MYFGQFLCPSPGVFHRTHRNGLYHTACEQDQDGTTVPSWSCSQAVSKNVWHIPLLFVQWKTPDDGQRNCPKHVEFYSKNKFEKLVHLVGFIIIIYHDARSPERQIPLESNKNNWHITWRPMYICISPNSSWNCKCFTKTLQRKPKHILCSVIPPPKTVPFMRQWENAW